MADRQKRCRKGMEGGQALLLQWTLHWEHRAKEPGQEEWVSTLQYSKHVSREQ